MLRGGMTVDRALLGTIIGRYEEASFTVNRRISVAIREKIPEELTLDQYGIIRYLRNREGSTSSELADVFCVGKSSITAITTRLFDKNLIVRLPDEYDRRVVYLRLTEEGERLADEIAERIEDVLVRYLQHFDEKEAIAFIETFEKLANVLLES
jgi:DNA-binding MarR family transcriptional regulator